MDRAKITAGLGTILVAALAAALTHYLDNANWERQHKVEQQEYRQLQAEKVFDSVTTLISRFVAANNAVNVYKQGPPSKEKELRNETLLQRQLEFETAYPLQRVMVGLYFSDTTSKAFERMADLVGRAYTETQGNIVRGADQHLQSAQVLTDKLTTLATMMASELAKGITK